MCIFSEVSSLGGGSGEEGVVKETGQSTILVFGNHVERQFAGSMHQPTWGAALLLRPQASPPPCSLSPQVASFQVCFKTASILLFWQLSARPEAGRAKRGADPDEVFAPCQRHTDPLS